jgi:GGDEF domain-containing protein
MPRVRRPRNLRCIDPSTGVRERPTTFSEHRIPLSVLPVEIDGMRQFRVSHGASVVAAILRLAAQTIESSFRPTDFLESYAENKFLTILAECSGTEVKRVADRLLTGSSESLHFAGRSIYGQTRNRSKHSGRRTCARNQSSGCKDHRRQSVHHEGAVSLNWSGNSTRQFVHRYPFDARRHLTTTEFQVAYGVEARAHGCCKIARTLAARHVDRNIPGTAGRAACPRTGQGRPHTLVRPFER